MMPQRRNAARCFVWSAIHHLAAVALLSLGVCVPHTATAAEKPIPTLPPLDDDFPLQGEYAGNLQTTGGGWHWTGLQVVALGDGKFDAVEYAGGLPGNGGTMENRRKYSGAKTAGAVELTADGRKITVANGSAVVRDGAGAELGRLQKYHRLSQALRAPAPSHATVLFNGTNTDDFTNGSMTADHLLNVGCDTKQDVTDFTLHLEFRTPYMPAARGQGRGNSGVYIQGRYEVQILDSFGLDGLNNECGGLYKAQPPIVNMCFPPMAWQTYDIDFTAATFDSAGAKTAPARITVRHNGIVVQKDYAIPNKTGGGALEGPKAQPIKLQNHNNAVHFRNIWIINGKPGVRSDDTCPPCRDLPSNFTWQRSSPNFPALTSR